MRCWRGCARRWEFEGPGGPWGSARLTGWPIKLRPEPPWRHNLRRRRCMCCNRAGENTLDPFWNEARLAKIHSMSTQDEEIARHLREALASGELAGTKGFGEPFTEDEAWNATPESLRMPFKILRNAGFVPPEVELFHARAALTASLEASKSEQERAELLRKLSELQQTIALRLEALRVNGSP